MEVIKGDVTVPIRLPANYDLNQPVMTKAYGNNTAYAPVVIKSESVPVHVGSLPPHNPGPYIIEDNYQRRTISDPFFLTQRRPITTSTEGLNMRMAEAASIARVDRLEDTFVGVTAQARAALNQVTEVQMNQNDQLSAQNEQIRMLQGQLQSLAHHVESLTPTASPAENVPAYDPENSVDYDPEEDFDVNAFPPDSDGDDGTGLALTPAEAARLPSLTRPERTDYKINYTPVPAEPSDREGVHYSIPLTNENEPTPTEGADSPSPTMDDTVDPIAIATPVDPIAVVTPVDPTVVFSSVDPIATGHVPEYMDISAPHGSHTSEETNPVIEGYLPNPLPPCAASQETGTSTHHRESLIYMASSYGSAASTSTPRRSTAQQIIGAVKGAVRSMTPRSRSVTPPPPTGEKPRCMTR